MISKTYPIPTHWIGKNLKVALLGVGGTGYYIGTQLLMIERVLKDLSDNGGFVRVDLYDPKAIAAPNLARTGYLAGEIGYNKAQILSHRLNTALGYRVFNGVDRVAERRDLSGYDIIISATDSLESRMMVANLDSPKTLWLDTGVDEATASCVLGELRNVPDRLPHSADLFPNIDESAIEANQKASCDMRESLARQSFGINQAIAGCATNILSQLLFDGEIRYHGAMMDLKSGFTSPIAIDEQTWASFGYTAAA